MTIHVEGGMGGDVSVRDWFTPLFVVGFAVVTLADIGSTYICVRHLGLAEVNPFTDTSSFWGLLWPELIAWGMGGVMVRCGYVLGRRSGFYGAAAGCGFVAFRRRVLSGRGLPFAVLLVVPLALMLARLVPVAGNTSFMVWGKDPYDEVLALLVGRFDGSVYWTYVATQVVLLGIWLAAALWLVFRMARVAVSKVGGA